MVTSHKLVSRDFWRICNSVLNKSKSTIPPLFNNLKVLTSSKDKAELFAKTFFITILHLLIMASLVQKKKLTFKIQYSVIWCEGYKYIICNKNSKSSNFIACWRIFVLCIRNYFVRLKKYLIPFTLPITSTLRYKCNWFILLFLFSFEGMSGFGYISDHQGLKQVFKLYSVHSVLKNM